MTTNPIKVTFSTVLPGALALALAAPAAAQGPIALPPGLSGFWAMDGDADDFGPLLLHGAVAGAGGAFVPGQVAQGFLPQALDGCIAVPDAPELDVRNDFTFEGWVRLDALPAGLSYLVNKGSTAHRSTPYAFGVIGQNGALPVSSGASVTGTRGPGRLFVSLSDGALEQVVIAGTPLPVGSFAHVAFVVLPVTAQSQCRIFVNGVQVGYAWVGRFPFAGAQALQFGGTAGGGSFGGVVDEWTFYRRGLAAAELLAIYSAGPQGKQKPSFDVNPPVVAIVQPANGSVLGDRLVAVEARVADDSPTAVTSTPTGLLQSLPAGGGTATGAVQLLGPDGEHLIAVSATDSSSNTAASSVTVTLDTTAPLVAVLTPAPGAVLASTPARFSVQVDDLTATAVTVAGRAVALPPGQHAVAFDLDLREGGNAVTFTATDAAGNRTTVVHDVVLDLDAPVVSLVSPPDGALFGAGAQTVAVTARVDDLTATRVGSTPAGLAGSLPPGGGLVAGVLPLAEGLNQLRVRASDDSGRSGEAVVTVNRDGTAPLLQFAAPAADLAVRGLVEVRIDAADVAPGSGVAAIELYDGSVLLQRQAGASLRLDLDTRALADGQHLLRGIAEDGAGNRAEAQLRLSVDNTPPVLRILQPVADSIVQGSVPFVATAADGGSGLVAVVQRVGGRAPSLDGSQQFATPVPSAQCDGSDDSTQWPDGALQFEVEATDAAGNTAVLPVEVQVQNHTGEGPGLWPRQGATVRGCIDIRVRSDAAGVTGLELWVDGRRLASGPGPRLQQRFDTAVRLDGPLAIRAVVHTLRGAQVTEHTVQVDNLRVLGLTPPLLSLQADARGSGSVLVAGRSVGLLLPLAQHQVELRLPGGASVPLRSAKVLGGGRSERLLALSFDRGELVQTLRAARATGALTASSATLQLFVDGVDIGRSRLWLLPERGSRGQCR